MLQCYRVKCNFWYMLLCYYATLLSVSTVYCLLRRCCWPSRKNFAALKQFGVCDNKHFDFDFDLFVPHSIGYIT